MNIKIIDPLIETLVKYAFTLGYIYLILIFVFTVLILIYHKTFQNFISGYTRTVYQLKKYRPIFLTITTVISIILIFLIIVKFQPIEYEEYDVTQQIEKLDEMQNSLENLQSLISAQKEKLINTEKYIELLKMEKQKLEPIVKANRELVESILTLQKERTMSQVWKDRFIGFVISVLAGLVIVIFRNFWRSWKS